MDVVRAITRGTTKAVTTVLEDANNKLKPSTKRSLDMIEDSQEYRDLRSSEDDENMAYDDTLHVHEEVELETFEMDDEDDEDGIENETISSGMTKAHKNFSKEALSDNKTREAESTEEDPTANKTLELNHQSIRSKIEKWRKTSVHIVDLHKQDLLRYNILDTIDLSATEARVLFKDIWCDMISSFEAILEPNSEPINEDEENGKAEEVKIYAKNILKTTTSIKKLREVIKATRAELRTGKNLRWKRRTLALMKVFRDQFRNGKNGLVDKQTEYNYIINFISRVFVIMFKDIHHLSFAWGEQALRCSAILLNQSQKDNSRRSPGNKIDAIIMLTEPGLEFSVLEVSSSPSNPDHTHYIGDRNKIAKNLKVILNFIRKKYPGDFEQFRKIKVYGIQVYDQSFYIYTMSMPFPGVYYFKQKTKFECPTSSFIFFKALPNFLLSLWIMRDIIISSAESIISYIASSDLSGDDGELDPVVISPKKKRAAVKRLYA